VKLGVSSLPERSFHWLFMGSERIVRERNKGENHQNNSIKTASLIPKFTQWTEGKTR
jgi:hypothetical protein